MFSGQAGVMWLLVEEGAFVRKLFISRVGVMQVLLLVVKVVSL